MPKEKELIKKFWNFLKKDTLISLIVTLAIAFLAIKFIFFPLLSLVTGTPLPLVIVESCSMYHSDWSTDGLEQVLENPIYADYNLTFENTKKWNFRYGLNKGDIIFVIRPTNLKAGDVLIFEGGGRNPIIHRIISVDKGKITTKGDHNSGFLDAEKNIQQEQLIGKAVFRIPVLGWGKLIFFEASRPAGERGLCK